MTSIVSKSAKKTASLKDTFSKMALPLAGLLTVAIPYAVPMGPVGLSLVGALLLGAAGYAFGGTINKREPHEVSPDFESYWSHTQKGDKKVFAAVGAVLGVILGVGVGSASDSREHLKSLPEIDAATPVRNVTLTMADEHCKGKASGSKLAVTHNGKQYRLICP